MYLQVQISQQPADTQTQTRRLQDNIVDSFQVASILRRWREVVIPSPSVWSHLLSKTTGPRWDTRFTECFSPRLGASSESSDITTHKLELVPDRSIGRVFESIVPHCRRWRKLCVRPWREEDLEHIWSAIRDISDPLLQQIEILAQDEGTPEHTSDTPSFILGAPALKSVSLRGLCVGYGLPLANLTAFLFDSAYSALSRQQLKSVISASPALRDLQLRLGHFTSSASDTTNIYIPSLRPLSLNFRYIHPGDDLFHPPSIMIAPALEHLELISLRGEEMGALQALCQETEFPKHPHLHTLKLLDISPPSASSYKALFGLFPSVMCLYINGVTEMENPDLSQLPALRYLTYNYTYPGCLIWDDHDCVQWILRHVRDCQGTRQALETVRIGRAARGVCEEADYEALRDLVDLVGLDDDADSLQDSWGSDREVEFINGCGYDADT
ncbi:hypothetical protein FIBSPDRAFT_898164 [Athelia psychrophila]|uniref:F-box domain-containing protein n=1 Tax=Athelia psychrophila TaxID=1759441 RepID=A0A166BDG1_9AGAM|nr:hypothetical protein FIBSPDRAFT_898164 [Fibularhizoctonia sp. CBS 109695]